MLSRCLLAFGIVLVGCGASVEEEPSRIVPAVVEGVTRNLAYGDSPLQRLDLFAAKATKAPLIVFVHGGAWQGGSRHEYDAIASKFQAEGLNVATVDYQLSPAVKHPTHAEDTVRALVWLRENAAKYGYDPKRIVIAGHSAGAHIAATIATSPKLFASAHLAGFVGLEGIYDLPSLAKRWPSYPNWFLNNAFGSDQPHWASASPSLLKVVGKTPWLLVHSKADELVDLPQTDEFAEHLRKAGVSVRVEKPDAKSHFGVVGSLAKPGDDVAEAIVRFVNAITMPK